MSEEVGHDCSKGVIKLRAVFGGRNEVDGDGILGGQFGPIENELILFSILDKVVLKMLGVNRAIHALVRE